MLFWVYPLRWRGQRRGRNELARDGCGLLGEVVMEPHEIGWRGRPMQLARLFKPDTTEEILPSMVECRVVGIRRTLLICGFEQVMCGRKSVDRYQQTWICASAPIAPIEWAALRAGSGRRHSTGFDPDDDDVA